MFGSASRKKVTAVLLETRVLEQIELMTRLSTEELYLLETEIVKRLENKPNERLSKLLTIARLINLLKAARDVFSRESSDRIRYQVKKAMRRRLMASIQKDENHE